jgi:hypothetical protein
MRFETGGRGDSDRARGFCFDDSFDFRGILLTRPFYSPVRFQQRGLLRWFVFWIH